MESLEELKAISTGKPDDAQSVMMVCNPIYTKLENGFWYAACKGQDWLQVTDKQIGSMRSLSDIERIIELMEQLNKSKPVKEECKHRSSTASYTHVTCDSCHMIRTDGGWGCASRKWFDNVESAKFYEKNGFLPK